MNPTRTLLLSVICALILASSLAHDQQKKKKPPSTMGPAQPFISEATTPQLKTTTTHPPKTTTTHPPKTTTTPPPKTTTTHPPKTTTTHQPNTTTTHHPNTTTTHQPNTTTTHQPNTTTTHHPNTTTTHHPNTTTTHQPNTTTTHQPNTTTTHQPNTTTTHQPNTTTPTTAPPTPTQPANLTQGTYNVTGTDGNVCILAQMTLRLMVQYKNTTNSMVQGVFIVQPQQTRASGNCSHTKSSLMLSFHQGHITFLFTKDSKNNSVFVDFVDVSLNYMFPNAKETNFEATNSSVELFKTRIGHSYSCKNETVIMRPYLYLELSEQKIQAFNITKNTFGPADNCPADKPDYRVAIVVGVVLALLIIIVVIVYLIGRKKRTSGYQAL
ncbi:macrosialin-like [Lepisosteus oculatus]|uniref:macrosialin-like n=1 Tax=Lepisosteus oculatus TaxID=7918 RepID=UPI003712C541